MGKKGAKGQKKPGSQAPPKGASGGNSSLAGTQAAREGPRVHATRLASRRAQEKTPESAPAGPVTGLAGTGPVPAGQASGSGVPPAQIQPQWSVPAGPVTGLAGTGTVPAEQASCSGVPPAQIQPQWSLQQGHQGQGTSPPVHPQYPMAPWLVPQQGPAVPGAHYGAQGSPATQYQPWQGGTGHQVPCGSHMGGGNSFPPQQSGFGMAPLYGYPSGPIYPPQGAPPGPHTSAPPAQGGGAFRAQPVPAMGGNGQYWQGQQHAQAQPPSITGGQNFSPGFSVQPAPAAQVWTPETHTAGLEGNTAQVSHTAGVSRPPLQGRKRRRRQEASHPCMRLCDHSSVLCDLTFMTQD